MEREPSYPVEHDGDVVSRADFDSFEQTYFEDPVVLEAEHEALLDEEATRAAMAMVGVEKPDEEIAPEPELEVDPEDAKDEALLRAAEAEYERLCKVIETREDQGVDVAGLQQEADSLLAHIKELQQNMRTRRHMKEIRHAEHERAVEAINTIPDPVKRATAMRELLAKEQARAARRGRRY